MALDNLKPPKPIVEISVRDLVETVMKEGNLFASRTMHALLQEGLQIHKEWQQQRKLEDEEYIAEYPLFFECERNQISFRISGRMDGLFIKNGSYYVEEIKSTIIPLEKISEETFPVHWAQAKVYAYLFAIKNAVSKMYVVLTYYQKETKEIQQFKKCFLQDTLRDFFFSLLDHYAEWLQKETLWEQKRNQSIEQLTFPFHSFRKGQYELIESVQNATEKGDVLFAQAPTGIGKTMAVLYGTIQNIPKVQIQKIFYLTARTVARIVAEKAFALLRQNGLQYRVITLTAKEKICPMGVAQCIGDKCPYAEGYYDRVDQAILAILEIENQFVAETIVLGAQKYRICPFEFSLDLSLWCDCIICDYNYVFDPKVYLKRYFFGNTGNGKYVFLIDEAHNMVKRSQEMFSATLSESSLLQCIHSLHPDEDLREPLEKVKQVFSREKERMEQDEQSYLVEEDVPENTLIELENSFALFKQKIESNKNREIPDLITNHYFDLQHFIKIHDYFDHRYRYLLQLDTKGAVLCKEFCLDPSTLLQSFLQRSFATVYFSATLSPIHYFVRMLGGSRDSIRSITTSPFPKENLHVTIEKGISTKYKERQSSYEQIAKYIQTVVNVKIGNYLVFFPSYAYMNQVFASYSCIKGKTSVLQQKSYMTEKDREAFLQAFSYSHGRALVGFAVMGGIFGEGIDLVGDRLSGAMIVGVGLPGLSLENFAMKSYFDENDESGYGYAFVYPGINRVLQAVGRVIRTEQDQGVVLLIDPRFDHPTYRKLLPEEWGYVPAIQNISLYKSLLTAFWKERES